MAAQHAVLRCGFMSRCIFELTRRSFCAGRSVSSYRKYGERKNKPGPKRVVDKLVLPKCSTLDDLMHVRRRQAQCSILVQHSSDNLPHVFNKCVKYGNIKLLFSYQRGDKNLLLIEFEDQESVQNVMSDARHFGNDLHMPIETPFLFLPRIEDGRNHRNQERLLPEREHLLFREINKRPGRMESDLMKEQSISSQIMTQYNNLRMTDLHTRERFMMCHLVEGILKRVFGECFVHPFGSSFSGFGKHDCDLDMVCDLNRGKKAKSRGVGNGLLFLSKLRSEDCRQDQQNNLAIVADIMQYIMPQSYSVKRILRASVPIIRFNHATNLQCDISMENKSAYYMTELLHLYGKADYRVCPLVFAIRHWAKEVELTSAPSAGHCFSNFMFTLLAIFYLQQGTTPLLPTVNALKDYAGPSDVKAIDGEDCTFVSDWTNVPASKNSLTLEELFHGFLEFYAKFDFENGGVDVVSGEVVEKPPSSVVYMTNPIERELNVCKNITETELLNFKEQCQNSLKCLEDQRGLVRRGNTPWGLLSFGSNKGRDNHNVMSMNISSLFSENNDTSSNNAPVAMEILVEDQESSITVETSSEHYDSAKHKV